MPDDKSQQRTGEQKQGEQKPGESRSMENRIADLEQQLAQTRAGLPLTTIPEHGAGPGTEIRETWSQGDQDASRFGEYEEPEPAPEPKR